MIRSLLVENTFLLLTATCRATEYNGAMMHNYFSLFTYRALMTIV